MCDEPKKLIIVSLVPSSIFAESFRARAISKIEGKDAPYSNEPLTLEDFEHRQAKSDDLNKERQLYYNQILGDRSEWDQRPSKRFNRSSN